MKHFVKELLEYARMLKLLFTQSYININYVYNLIRIRP